MTDAGVTLRNALSEFSSFLEDGEVAVAVSGGPDSLSLAHVLGRWCADHGKKLHILHVNHNLRREAEKEADHVKKWAHSSGFLFHELKWEFSCFPSSGVQEKAREARYALLEEKCRELSIKALFLGHHKEDREETFLMNIWRGSGLQGLMSPQKVITRGDVFILRPWLSIEKKMIFEYAHHYQLPYIQDSSNRNPDFTRVRIRNLLRAVMTERFPSQISKSIQKLELAHNALQYYVQEVCGKYANFHEAGFITLDLCCVDLYPLEIMRRVVCFLINHMSPGAYEPSFERQLFLVNQLKEKRSLKPFTLRGCYIKIAQKKLWIMRELAAIITQDPFYLGNQSTFVWDHRFIIEPLASQGAQIKIAPLGLQGYDAIKAYIKEKVQELPHCVILALPSFWKEDRLIEVPYLGFLADGESSVARVSLLSLKN